MRLDLEQGDSREVLAEYPDGYFTAVVCDPPYGLSSEPDAAEVLRHWLAGDDYEHRGGGFMGKSWDSFVPGPALWKEVLRVLKPGGTLLAFAGSRTHDLMSMAIRLAGFEVRDCLMWVYGTGFPKSLAIDKAIDKMRYDRPEVLEVTAWIAKARDAAGLTNKDIDAAFGFAGMAGHWTSQKTQPTVPTLEQVPLLLAALKDPEVPERIRQLLWDLNGRKGTPGADWFRREVVGEVMKTDTSKVKLACAMAAQGVDVAPQRLVQITEPTERSRPWKGYGTALKPAYEPVVVAMKPTEGTFAQNAMKHGVAGINVDACRIATTDKFEQHGTGATSKTDGWDRPWKHDPDALARCKERAQEAVERANTLGRWPANLAHDGSDEVLECFPAGERGGGFGVSGGDPEGDGIYNGGFPRGDKRTVGYGDNGGAARFFYCAKASGADRDQGLDDLPVKTRAELTDREEGSAGSQNPRAGAGSKVGRRNVHPTVKPTELMRWLVRMVKMPGANRILDPFAGSGSTGVACALEGVDFVGVEKEPEYAEIARRRIAAAACRSRSETTASSPTAAPEAAG